MDDNYRLVSRIHPEIGIKQWGVERDTYPLLSLITRKPKGKMCYLTRIEVGEDRRKLIIYPWRPHSHWVQWWHNRGEVEIAMERYLDEKRNQFRKEKENKKFQQAAEEHGVKVERYF